MRSGTRALNPGNNRNIRRGQWPELSDAATGVWPLLSVASAEEKNQSFISGFLEGSNGWVIYSGVARV